MVHIGIILLVFSVTLFAINPALGQGFFDEEDCPDCGSTNPESESGITVWTDSSSYDRGEFIKLFGEVDAYVPYVEVGLVVIGPPPFNNVVAIDSIEVEEGNTFATTLATTGQSWENNGTYTIKVTYGNQEVNDRVLINLGIVDPTPISLTTDKLFYEQGNIVGISGFIKNLNENNDQLVQIRIVDPENHFLTILQTYPNSDGTYSTEIIAGGTWKVAGEYSIYANYGAQKAEVTFEFAGGEGYTPPPSPETESIFVNGAFTKNGIAWCEIEKPLYDLRGNEQFFEHHNYSIESRICAMLYEDPFWKYNNSDRIEKLIDRSRYYSELEIAESQDEAKVGVLDTAPAEVLPTIVFDFIDTSKGSQYYLDRYYNESAYKDWFHTYYPGYTIEEAIRLTFSDDAQEINPEEEPEQKIPDWVRNIFIWYAEERISEDELLGAIQFLIDQGILES